MKILALETSCDETSIAILSGDEQKSSVAIAANIVSSQIKVHAPWGGVVPNLAAREHVKNAVPVLEQALKNARVKLNQIDLFAVTAGPGLIPALLIGVNAAKALSYFHQKPLLGVHHVEGHLVSAFFDQTKVCQTETCQDRKETCRITADDFPVLCLTVSGGHTQLILSRDLLNYEIIGETQDDAAGEAFDKVAKLLELGYPGGPVVEKLAREYSTQQGHSEELALPRPMLKNDNFNFSFSGLKTAVLYQWEKRKKEYPEQELKQLKQQFCYEFQQAVADVLTQKTLRAAKQYHSRTIILAGGVAANQTIREKLAAAIRQDLPTIKFSFPAPTLCGDNAAMIGAAAFFRYQKLKKTDALKRLSENWKNLSADANAKIKNLA